LNDMTQPTPTLYEWAGGAPALERLMTLFYARVPADPLIGPLFAHMSPDHARHVAEFVGEVLNGPPTYSADRGGHGAMIRHHLLKRLNEAQRTRWVRTLLDCADEAGLPADPEFRSAFVAYLEWGSRIAVINSQPDATPSEDAPMPHWGWGEVGGPYQG
jgi:hemoglobin